MLLDGSTRSSNLKGNQDNGVNPWFFNIVWCLNHITHCFQHPTINMIHIFSLKCWILWSGWQCALNCDLTLSSYGGTMEFTFDHVAYKWLEIETNLNYSAKVECKQSNLRVHGDGAWPSLQSGEGNSMLTSFQGGTKCSIRGSTMQDNLQLAIPLRCVVTINI